jgi:hypothetical protein
MEALCRRDLFIYAVLDGGEAPDHVTINRFIQRHPRSIEQVLTGCCRRLAEMGELSKEVLFQDGTKIESRANKYSFVWKSGIEKSMSRLRAKCIQLAQEAAGCLCLEHFCIDELDDEMNKLRILKAKIEGCGRPYAIERRGKGVAMTAEQRLHWQIEQAISKHCQYVSDLKAIGDGRRSMSKTDREATFMHLKEDHMRNGQLKPAYNIQALVDSNYIVGCHSSSDRNDYATMKPALEKISASYGWRYKEYCADSGYDSLQNHQLLERLGMTDYIKPQNYEIAKTRKAREDISLYQNMEYDSQRNEFICAAGRRLGAVGMAMHKSSSGASSPVTTYACKRGCVSCPLRRKCNSGKKPRKYKTFTINIDFELYRRKALANITSQHGAEVRANRSIQAEGAFAQIKANLAFRRFLCFGKQRTTTEWVLMCITMNAIRLGYRLQSRIAGTPFWYSVPA